MASEPVKVTYFNGRGRAESIRWCLAAADIKWEHVGLNTPEDFDAVKASGKLLTNQVPLVEMDGLNIVQSGAAIRYIARKAGLYGDTDADRLRVDMAVETVRDLCDKTTMPLPFAVKTAGLDAHKVTMSTFCDKYLPVLERMVVQNPDSDAHFAGKELTLADVLCAEMLWTMHEVFGPLDGDWMAPYPHLKRVAQTTWAHPPLAAYLADDTRHFPLPGDAYTVNVDTVLRRLP